MRATLIVVDFHDPSKGHHIPIEQIFAREGIGLAIAFCQGMRIHQKNGENYDDGRSCHFENA
jgi:hypothetical protein